MRIFENSCLREDVTQSFLWTYYQMQIMIYPEVYPLEDITVDYVIIILEKKDRPASKGLDQQRSNVLDITELGHVVDNKKIFWTSKY